MRLRVLAGLNYPMKEKAISDFIKKQKLATLCCLDDRGNPYCFSCFFAFNSDDGLLYFKSSASSSHGQYLQQNRILAGTIHPDKLNLLAIQGIQFTGELVDNCKHASLHYHKRFPFALAMSGELYTVRINTIKMTDNTKGFGKKFTWQREEVSQL